MSSINVCDRCGGLVTGIALGSVTVRTSADPSNTETVHKEICPDCTDIIVTLLETAVEPLQKTPYRKAWLRVPSEEDDTVRNIIRTVVEEVHNAQKAITATTRVDSHNVVQG